MVLYGMKTLHLLKAKNSRCTENMNAPCRAFCFARRTFAARYSRIVSLYLINIVIERIYEKI